jgi:hypothetical protein
MSKKQLPQFIMFAKEGDKETIEKIEFIKQVMESAAKYMGHKVVIQQTSVEEYITDLKKNIEETPQNE